MLHLRGFLRAAVPKPALGLRSQNLPECYELWAFTTSFALLLRAARLCRTSPKPIQARSGVSSRADGLWSDFGFGDSAGPSDKRKAVRGVVERPVFFKVAASFPPRPKPAAQAGVGS